MIVFKSQEKLITPYYNHKLLDNFRSFIRRAPCTGCHDIKPGWHWMLLISTISLNSVRCTGTSAIHFPLNRNSTVILYSSKIISLVWVSTKLWKFQCLINPEYILIFHNCPWLKWREETIKIVDFFYSMLS